MIPTLSEGWIEKPRAGHWVYAIDMYPLRFSYPLTVAVSAWIEGLWQDLGRNALRRGIGVRGYNCEDDLPLWIRERLAVLRIAGDGVYVSRVGVMRSGLHIVRRHNPERADIEQDPAQEGRFFDLEVLT